MKTSVNGISIIKEFEGIRLTAYQCSGLVWTIGWGTTKMHGVKVKEGDIIDMETAEDLFLEDLRRIEDIVNARLLISITQNQFDALVSHTYNTGGSDNLFDFINSDAGKKKIHNWFVTTYVTSKSILVPGLVNRRKKEADLFFRK